MKRVPFFSSIKAILLLGILMSIVGINTHTSAAGVNTTLALNNDPNSGAWVDGYIGNSDDIDYYTFSISSSGWVTITYQGLSISSSNYSINNSDQTTRLASEYVSSSATTPTTKTTTLALDAGSYIVIVQANSSNTGNYRIRGSFEAAGNVDREPNDSFQTAMPIDQDSNTTGFFSLTDDLDFYSFNVATECNVDITVTARTYMSYSLWNQDLIKQKNSSASGSKESPSTSKLSKLTLTPGTYYIKCESSSTGAYNVKWSLSPVPVSDIVISGNKNVVAGKTIQLSAMAVPANASDKRVVWESSNTQVATVDFNSGLVTTLTAGTATITAKAVDGSNVKKNETIIVTPKKMAKPKVKAGKKRKITISWKTVPGVNQYDIQYGTKSNFKKAKTRSYSIYYKKVTLTMKKKGTYYVRMRATTDLFGKKVRGAWSKAVKVKAK